jgi:hypothetical protein
MAQKADLAAALAEQAGSTRTRQSESLATNLALEPQRRVYRQPGRVTLVPITAHFPREVRRQLKGLAFEHDRTIHDVLAEFLNDGFAKYGKPEICPRSKEPETSVRSVQRTR